MGSYNDNNRCNKCVFYKEVVNKGDCKKYVACSFSLEALYCRYAAAGLVRSCWLSTGTYVLSVSYILFLFFCWGLGWFLLVGAQLLRD